MNLDNMFCCFPQWFNGEEDAANELLRIFKNQYCPNKDKVVNDVLRKYGIPQSEKNNVLNLLNNKR